MKWILIAMSAVAAAIALVALAGSMLPRKHHAVRSARFRQPVETVWEVLADPLAGATWRKDVKSVERLPDREGRMVWKEVDRWGDGLTLELAEDEPPRRRVVRIADPSLPFGGTWTYVLSAEPEGARLTITEDGEVRNPIFRFLARFVFGHGRTLETYLASLGRRFGEDVKPS
jgi:uncharacterized protein YndB with AHSA1/START domain